MPGYSFTTIEPNQIGQVTKWDVPVNDWLGLKFGNSQADTLGSAISRRVEDSIYDDGGTASVEVLNKSFGIDSRLTFTEPMSIQRARLINERKRSEIEYQSYFQSASHSWFSAKAAAGFGAAMVGSLAHPLDLGLTFMPFVGSEKAAAGVAKMGAGQVERLAARGLITEEQLARIGIPMPRLSGALIDGAVNQLAMEVPIALQKRRDMADYDSSDFAFNVIAGGAFSAGVKAVGLAFERAARAWMGLDPKIKDAAPLKALREILTGEPARFEADFKLDESTIRAQVTERIRAANPFDEAAARAGYTGPKADIGSGEPVIRYESKTAQVGEVFEDAGLTYKVTSVKDGEATAVQAGAELFSQKYSPELEVIAQKEARGLQLTPDDAAKVEQLIDPETPNAHADYQRRVTQIENEFEIPKYMDEQRRINLENYVAQKQSEYEARVKNEVDAETQKAIAEIRRQSEPPLTPEQIQKYTSKVPDDDASIKLVEDEANELMDSVVNSMETVEDQVRLKAEIESEMKLMKERGVSAEKAIDALIPCATAKAKIL